MNTRTPMNSRAQCKLIVDAIEALKGQNIVELDVRKLTDVTDYMIVASGRSRRQVIAIAEKVIQAAKDAGIRPLGSEGLETGDWVLVDLVDVIVHVMDPQTREYFQLEKLWTEHEPATEGRTGS